MYVGKEGKVRRSTMEYRCRCTEETVYRSYVDAGDL